MAQWALQPLATPSVQEALGGAVCSAVSTRRLRSPRPSRAASFPLPAGRLPLRPRRASQRLGLSAELEPMPAGSLSQLPGGPGARASRRPPPSAGGHRRPGRPLLLSELPGSLVARRANGPSEDRH